MTLLWILAYLAGGYVGAVMLIGAVVVALSLCLPEERWK